MGKSLRQERNEHGGKESVGNKVSNATKGAVNKVKGLFKKKK